MPDPEKKDLSGKLTEYGEGVFVTKAMLDQIPAVHYPGSLVNSKERSEVEMLKEVIERLDDVKRLLKLIFDGHVLINGRFRKITP